MGEEKQVPACLAFIMDGNRRWAEAQGLSRLEGHSAGYQKLKEVVSWAHEHSIAHMVVYALSTENWKRSEKEVAVLLNLLRKMVKDELDTLKQKGVCIRFRGEIGDFPEDIQRNMRTMEKETRENAKGTLTVLVSYGGRAEIAAATQKVAHSGEDITVDTLKNHMWLSDVPEPDMIVRTGGEKRLSNFLLWHAAYSELYFIDTFWPALTREDFDNIVAEYGRRNRRYGV